MSEYGQELRRLRQERGLSLRALADALGVSPPYLSDVELGKRAALSIKRSRRAEEILGLAPGELLTRSHCPTCGQKVVR